MDMTTQATNPKFTSYADVIKAVEAAKSKDALNELADLVDDEFTSERLALTDENWADFACRVLLRHDHIQNQPVAAPAPAESADLPSTIIATYVSVWDGSVNLETPCVIDLATGLVESVLVDTNGLAICDLEFVRLAEGQEFEVTLGEGMIADLESFQQAAQKLASTKPVDPVLLAIEVLQALRPDLAAAVKNLAVQAEAAGAALAEPAVPVVVIESGGGVIHCIRSSAPVEIIQLDADVEDGDTESQVLLTVGNQEYALNARSFSQDVTGGHEGVDVEFCSHVRGLAEAKLKEGV
jgi:hypothetical protein